jgi:hypothetical protein
MDLVIKPDEIKAIDLNCFNDYHMERNEFHGTPGNEHYKLLAWLSNQFHDADIINVSTGNGSSAMALSFNQSNIVHTFDDTDKVYGICNSYKLIKNIKHNVLDISNPLLRSSSETLVFRSPLIMFNIDPRSGYFESDWYQYLEAGGYKGIFILIGIHMFARVKSLWERIPNANKFDISRVGNISGTGLITFNPDIKITWA